jgi:hypothetical protein
MNPIIPTVYAADPAARVWSGDDRIWVYASHDEPDANSHDSMQSYHAFCSSDLVHWTDHGIILHLDRVRWASSHMWAIDCVFRRGLYYLVYCAVERKSGSFRTGLATSDRPEGPFDDIGYIEGVEHGQDPAVLIDDDDTPYLYWGSGHNMHCCQLTDDLRAAVPGTYRKLTDELTHAFEGPWLHKHNGQYYLSYPGLLDRKWPERMYYAIAEKPLGPFKFAGEYIPRFAGQAGTNHGSIVNWKGQWLAFHHSMWVSNESVRRSLMCDPLEHNADGTIKPIVPTLLGVIDRPSRVDILLNAESAAKQGGKLVGVRVARDVSGYTGRGYVEGFDAAHHGVHVVAQVSHESKWRVVVRYRAPLGDEQLALMANNTKLAGVRDDSHDLWTGRFNFPQSSKWRELTLCEATLRPGNNFVRLHRGPSCTGGCMIDYIRLQPISVEPPVLLGKMD